MTYRGEVKGGVIILEGAAELPEGAKVRVDVLDDRSAADLPTLAERLGKVAGKAVGLPADLAENHDHYLHGVPKRKP